MVLGVVTFFAVDAAARLGALELGCTRACRRALSGMRDLLADHDGVISVTSGR